ncbi:MAG: hypothetical protein C4K60_07935 [Ideonella sp. MAG2]|nr:MAG: hypothetical protein C4K60_07935 [Ideonella sp. MAG2]
MKWLLFALFVSHSFSEATAAPLVYRAEQHCLASPGTRPCLARMEGHADTWAALNAQTLVVGGGSFAQQGLQFALLLTLSDSRPTARGRGLCGAGEELSASLWLLEQRKALARQVDTLKLASCLENIDMVQPASDFAKRLATAHPEQWKIDWLTHPVHGSGKHSVMVRGLKLVVEPLPNEGWR